MGGSILSYRYSNGVTAVRDDSMQYKSIIFTGTEGQVEVSREFLYTKPESLIRKHPGPADVHLYKSENHYGNWLDCIRTRKQPVCEAETGCRSLTVCHLGIIAHKLGRPLKWDPAKERFIGDVEAYRMLTRTTRSPWRLG